MQFTIRQARVHAGITQADIAKRLGMDRGTYLKMEKDLSRVTIGQINKISKITGIPAKAIFMGCISAIEDNLSAQDST